MMLGRWIPFTVIALAACAAPAAESEESAGSAQSAPQRKTAAPETELDETLAEAALLELYAAAPDVSLRTDDDYACVAPSGTAYRWFPYEGSRDQARLNRWKSAATNGGYSPALLVGEATSEDAFVLSFWLVKSGASCDGSTEPVRLVLRCTEPTRTRNPDPARCSVPSR
jgi:hypothetical protein